jgi:hypothetical protein
MCAGARPLNKVVRRHYVTVALTKIQEAQVLKSMDGFLKKRRPPAHIRHEIDIAFRLSGQSVELFEIRPKWRGKPGETMEHSIAKAAYVGTRRHWRIYWMRQDLKWHSYEPAPSVNSIDAFCKVVDEDSHCCFFG